MDQFPSLFNKQMIDLAKNAANAFVSTNESMKQAKPSEFIDLYLDVFKVAYIKTSQKIEEKNRQVENFEDCEKLPINSIR